MPRIIYLDQQEQSHSIEVESGYSLMEGAYNHEVPGILAECGGACACGTCHVYIQAEQNIDLPPIGDNEDSMLYFVNNRKNNSRLSCQVRVNEEMDGLIVKVADNSQNGF